MFGLTPTTRRKGGLSPLGFMSVSARNSISPSAAKVLFPNVYPLCVSLLSKQIRTANQIVPSPASSFSATTKTDTAISPNDMRQSSSTALSASSPPRLLATNVFYNRATAIMPSAMPSSLPMKEWSFVLRSAILPTTMTSSGYSTKRYTDLEDLRNIGTTRLSPSSRKWTSSHLLTILVYTPA